MTGWLILPPPTTDGHASALPCTGSAKTALFLHKVAQFVAVGLDIPMASKTSTPVVDAEIVDEPAALEPRSQRFDLDYSGMEIEQASYDELMQVPGFMVSGATIVAKGWLLGVPHIVTSATFWTPKASKDGLRMGMVSLEAVVANVDLLQRQIRLGRVLERIDSDNGSETRVIKSIDELGFYPGERVVYNDESTGIRRTVVKWLSDCGLITLPKTAPKGYSGPLFDLPWPEWEAFSENTTQGELVVPRFTKMASGNPFLIHAPRGLRVSEYSNDYTDEGLTYYFG